MLIALEGIDASGKATQSKILAKRLGAKLYSFPAYHTPAGKVIADHLQNRWAAVRADPEANLMPKTLAEGKRLDAFVLQSLMLTNRMELAAKIADDSRAGHVVCDRYWASALAYGEADGLDAQYLWDLHQILPRPTIQILIDVDPADSVTRRPERRDRYERQEGLMEEVAANYRRIFDAMSAGEPGGWAIVDGRGSIEEVSAAIWGLVESVRPTDTVDLTQIRQIGD